MSFLIKNNSEELLKDTGVNLSIKLSAVNAVSLKGNRQKILIELWIYIEDQVHIYVLSVFVFEFGKLKELR